MSDFDMEAEARAWADKWILGWTKEGGEMAVQEILAFGRRCREEGRAEAFGEVGRLSALFRPEERSR